MHQNRTLTICFLLKKKSKLSISSIIAFYYDKKKYPQHFDYIHFYIAHFKQNLLLQSIYLNKYQSLTMHASLINNIQNGLTLTIRTKYRQMNKNGQSKKNQHGFPSVTTTVQYKGFCYLKNKIYIRFLMLINNSICSVRSIDLVLRQVGVHRHCLHIWLMFALSKSVLSVHVLIYRKF